MAEPIYVGLQKQLFLDDYIIDEMRNVSRTFNPAEKHSGNPVLHSEKGKWDQWAIPTPMPAGTVLYDEKEGVFKMWYLVWEGDTSHSYKSWWLTCYAVSKDGLVWEKPNIGLFEYKGSRSNNIVIAEDMQSVIPSPDGSDPQRRYQMIYTITNKEFGGYGFCFSPDGVNWTVYPEPHFDKEADVAPTIFDELTGRYVSFMKVNRKVGRWIRRLVGISFSDDFVRWSKPQIILAPDEKDDEMADARIVAASDLLLYDNPWEHRTEFYSMAGFPYEGLYLGLLWVFSASGPTPDGGNQDGTIEVQLTSSRDLLHWKRVGERMAIIPCGMCGQWDHGMVGTLSRPLIVGDEIWIYYVGLNMTHGAEIYYVPGVLPPERIWGIGLAVIRSDGFISIDAGEEGTLTTKPCIFDGQELVINALTKTKRGWVRVEVLDERGQAIQGLDCGSCDAFTGDEVRHTVTWRGNPDISSLRGKIVRLRFYLKEAKLYSFAFRTACFPADSEICKRLCKS